MITENLIYTIAIYLRLSKDDDLSDESLSITNQRRILRDYIKKNFNKDVEMYEYIDDGYSGMNNIRPALNRMLEDLQKKRINCVIVKDCSRLARKNSLISYYVDELFYEENIRFISLLENFDNTIDKDTEKILFPSIFNEYHVKNTSKKVRATFENQAKTGLFTGGFAPYGYIKDPKDKHKLLIDPYAAEIVKFIFDEFIKGVGLQKICYELMDRGVKIPSIYKGMNRGLKSANYGKWTTKTLSDMLHNPTYAGHLTQHKSRVKNISSKHKVKRKPNEWIIAYNTCPAIIEQETFDIVQTIWDKNKRKQKNSYEHLLTGFLYCKECGHTIGITASKWKDKTNNEKIKFYCNCNYYKRMSRYNSCTPHRISYDVLENNVLNEISELCKRYIKTKNLEKVLKSNDKLETLKTEIEINIKNKDILIKNIDDKIKNLYDDKLSGFIEKNVYLEFKDKYDKEKGILENDIQELQKKLYQIKNKISGTEDKYSRIIKEFLSLKNIDREFLAQIVDKIEMDEEKNLYIHYKIKPLLDKEQLTCHS